MALNLEYLRIFHTVARHKSISRAAEELHLSQPTFNNKSTSRMAKIMAEMGLIPGSGTNFA